MDINRTTSRIEYSSQQISSQPVVKGDDPVAPPEDHVHLSSGKPAEKEWTLLFYNAGDADEAKMSTFSLTQLEKIGSDENTNVVAMNYRSPWGLEKITGRNKEFLGAKTYYVTRDPETPQKKSRLRDKLPVEAKSLVDSALSSPKDIQSPVIEEHPRDISMGSKETLREFLLKNIEKYPAKHYAITLSGHGAGFAGSMLMKHPKSRITNEELGEVLNEVSQKIGHKVDLVNMNTCYSGNAESLYPLKDSVEAVVSSEREVFANTQPFYKALRDLQDGVKNGVEISGKDLAKLMVEEARLQPLGNIYLKTLSAVDMEKFGTVVDAVRDLQKTLMDEKVDPAVIGTALEKSTKVSFTSFPKQIYLTDAGSFADRIKDHVTSPEVHKAADALQSALKETVIAEQHANIEMESATSRVLRAFFGSRKFIPEP